MEDDEDASKYGTLLSSQRDLDRLTHIEKQFIENSKLLEQRFSGRDSLRDSGNLKDGELDKSYASDDIPADHRHAYYLEISRTKSRIKDEETREQLDRLKNLLDKTDEEVKKISAGKF